MDGEKLREIRERLEEKLLEQYEARLLDGTISDTGMANLQRLLLASGFTLDEKQISTGLKSRLLSKDPAGFDEDPSVVARIGKTG